MIYSMPDMEQLVLKKGILPFFKNEIDGFSIEEETPRSLWFSDYEDGPWEWKGPVIAGLQAAYGKFFFNRAAYVRLDLYVHLLSLRRNGQTPLSLCHTEGARRIYEAICQSESLLTHDIRSRCGFSRPKAKVATPSDQLLRQAEQSAHITGHIKKSAPRTESLDTLLTRMQMQGLLCIANFEYRHTADGRPYGWGIARYTTPETLYPELFAEPLPDPQVSLSVLSDYMRSLFPNLSDDYLRRFLSGEPLAGKKA